MPNGWFKSPAKTSLSGLPSPSASCSTRTRSALLSATKRSPFGAATITRGFFKSRANPSTLNPSGAFGHAPSGRLTRFGLFLADSAAFGAGRSLSVNLRHTPGASVVQSPSAALPVSTFASAACGERSGNNSMSASNGHSRTKARSRPGVSVEVQKVIVFISP
jgi:hypothetical protein